MKALCLSLSIKEGIMGYVTGKEEIMCMRSVELLFDKAWFRG
jgi:hypothetical protein